MRYGSVTISMFINRLMRGGKKSTARGVMYDSLDLIEERTDRRASRCLTRRCPM